LFEAVDTYLRSALLHMALARCRDVELLPPDWNIGNSDGNLSGYTGLKKYY